MAIDKTIGVIGLGLMGTALSERLLEHGFAVHVWNRTRDKAITLLERGARWSDNPLADCRRVVISLYSSDIVSEVIHRMESGLQADTILIDTTTGEPDDCIAMAARMEKLGVHYLDSPISGSSEQTRRGEAMVMVSGDRPTFESLDDLWAVLSDKTFYVGESGSAAKMKLITNLVLGLNRAALAEGLAFATAIGVEASAALSILQESAAYSRVMTIKGRKMVTRDYQPQARLSQHLKDVRIILDTAMKAGRTLPLSTVHHQLLEQAESIGCGELDNSAIMKVYQSQDDQ